MIHPIWKDYFADLLTSVDTDFIIDMETGQDRQTIYSGRAVMRPSEDSLYVKMNDICADYVGHSPIPARAGLSRFITLPIFRTYVNGNSTDSVQFYPDWSYDESFNPYDRGLSVPVLSRIDRRQPLLFTAITDQVIVTGIDVDGNTQNLYWGGGDDIYMITLFVDLGEFTQLGKIEKIQITGGGYDMDYNIVDTCARYALCYVNAHGGWDSLLIEGNHSEVDNITRHTMDVVYENISVINRGKKNFVNEISKSMTLHTSWMSDDESSRMHHLLNSPDVYLYDMESEKMIPVLLKNPTTEYKTYKGNGGKLVNYAIEVEFANDRIRR